MIYRYKVQWIVVFFWQNIEVWTLLHPHTTHTTMRSSTMGKLCISRGIRGENPPETEGPKVNVRRVWRMSLSKNPPCPSFFSIQIGWIKAGLTPKQIMFMYFYIFVFTSSPRCSWQKSSKNVDSNGWPVVYPAPTPQSCNWVHDEEHHEDAMQHQVRNLRGLCPRAGQGWLCLVKGVWIEMSTSITSYYNFHDFSTNFI